MRRLHHLVGQEIEGGDLEGALVQDDQALPLHRPDVIAQRQAIITPPPDSSRTGPSPSGVKTSSER